MSLPVFLFGCTHAPLGFWRHIFALMFDRTLFHPFHSGLVLMFFGCARFHYLHSDPVLPRSKTQGLAPRQSHVTNCSAVIDRDEMLIYVLRSDWLWSIPAPTTTKQETAKVPTLQTLKHVIFRGWPENSSSVPKGSLSVFQCKGRTCRTRRNLL